MHIRRAFANRWVRYAVGPGLLLFGGQLPGPPKFGALALGFVLVTGGNVWADRTLGQEDARRSITLLLQNAVTMIEAARPGPPDRSLRANVMLFDNEAQGLRIAYSTAGYAPEEKSLIWQTGHGAAGQAWESARTVVAPEGDELPVPVAATEATSRPWNMTPAQIRATADRIASVVSAPVPHPERPGEVLAIFNLDDTKSLPESLLGTDDVRAAVEGLAVDSGPLLLRAGPGFPEPESEDSR